MKKTISTIAGIAGVVLCFSPVLSAGNRNGSVSMTDSLKAEKLYLPIGQESSRTLTTGSSRSIDGSVIEKYPGVNILNSLTGVIPGIFVTENTGATGVMDGSSNVSLTIRGFGGATFIVDDVVIPDASGLPLNPEEIESVTVLSDVLDKAKFGPEAARGAIYIRTLKGLPNTRKVTAGFEKGIDVIDILPEWCNGVEYATLNNKAREAAGYPTRFTDEAIQEYALNKPYDWEYPNVDYKNIILDNKRDYNKGYITIRGGGNNVLYSGNMGFVNQGDIYKVGESTNYNRFNAKMNLDMFITPTLNVNFSFIGIVSMRRSLLSAYGEKTSEQSFNNIWSRITGTPPVEYPLFLDVDEVTGVTNYAIDTEYPNHPYASVLSGGYNERTRIGVTKATVNYDFRELVKGLKSETQIGYDLKYTVRGGQGNDFVGWIFDPATEMREVTSHVGEKETKRSQYKGGTYLQGIQFHEKLSYDWTGNGHTLNTSFVYYRSKLSFSEESAYHRQQNYIFNAAYNYNRKYIAEIVANYAGSSALAPGHRYAMFPSAGLGWVASEESFLKDSSWLNYLKFRGQAGVIGQENYGSQYNWESYYKKTSGITYGPYDTNQWFGNSTSSLGGSEATRVANLNLGWEKNKEYSIGFDAVLFDKLSIGYTRYRCFRDGVVVDVANVLPVFYGASSMYDNYNQFTYWGNELSLTFADKVGDFSYSIGGFLHQGKGENTRYSETTTYDNIKRTGKTIGDVWGYDYIGKFASQAEADASIQTFDSQYHEGDLRYNDVTGDGIVDSNDQKVIGNSTPKLQYAINIYLSFKNLDLTVVGTGKAFFDRYLSNGYFFMGSGDGNYSKFVYDDLYPRLSYVKSTNNFQTSNYWRVDGGFFKIQNAELGYNFKFKAGNRMGISCIRLFARGANLLTISDVPYVDPESPSAGVSAYPLFKSYTGGIKFTF